MSNYYALILCGGSGTRLWPLSRKFRPKQLLALDGKKTLFQQTAQRLLGHVPPENLYTVTHEDYKFEVKGQLAEVAPDALANVLLEPYVRNTLPAIAWAVNQIYQKDPNAIIGVFSSDHAIDNEVALIRAWQTAEAIALQDYLVLLGIKPDMEATGYGYIKPGKKIADGNMPVFEVAQFVEKPDLELARQYIAKGFFWNSGIFVFKASVFKQMLIQYQPKMASQLSNIRSENFAETYANFSNISIDYGLAEKAEKIAIVPVDMGWSDLGSWESIYQKQFKDENNNVLHGDVVTQDTSDILLWSQTSLLATLGLNNVVVIQTADAILVCDKSRTEEIKPLVERIKLLKPELAETHLTVHRPWGNFTVLTEAANYKIKCIVVNPNSKLSLQMHNHRSEHWVVVKGKATVTNNGIESTLQENQSTFIPKTNHHRLENKGNTPLIIIEIQCGDYVGEDDIIRFEDQYGRTEK